MIVALWFGYLLIKEKFTPAKESGGVVTDVCPKEADNACFPAPSIPSSDATPSYNKISPGYSKWMLDFKKFMDEKEKESEARLKKATGTAFGELQKRFENECNLRLLELKKAAKKRAQVSTDFSSV